MRKIQILGALVAIFAFSAIATDNAPAAEWLLVGTPLSGTESATIDAKLILVHERGSLGKAKLECSIKLIGTVSPEGKDETKLVESLNEEKDLVAGCKTLEGFCVGATVHATKLPWTTKLEEISGKIWDTTSFGYDVLCSFGTQVECTGTLINALFEGNNTSGAQFSFKGAESGKMTCSDGGEGTLESLSPMTVLGFEAATRAAPYVEWLHEGKGVARSEGATTDASKLILVHERGSLGKAKMECDIKLIGTVSPEGKDETKIVESLTGEQDLIANCKTVEGFCLGSTVHAIKLPWTTRLEEVSEKTWDVTGFGYIVLCSFGTQVECVATAIKSLFDGNSASGAQFSFKGAESGKMTCSDGGEGTVETTEPMIVLGYEAA